MQRDIGSVSAENSLAVKHLSEWRNKLRTLQRDARRTEREVRSGMKRRTSRQDHGLPLTKALLNLGHDVVGVDSSADMLRRFHVNCPRAHAVKALLQACPFAAGTFDAAIAWGVVFHLQEAEQVRALADVSRVLRVDAPFLFTAGYPDRHDESQSVLGVMNGVEFSYYSFTKDGYRRLLGEHDFSLVDFHCDAGDNGYYLARKTGGRHP